jgi:hypothetical protein
MTWQNKWTNFSADALISQRQQKSNNNYFIQSKIAQWLHIYLNDYFNILLLSYFIILNIVVVENEHMKWKAVANYFIF